MSAPESQEERRASARASLLRVTEESLCNAERDILAGIEGSTRKAVMFREWIQKLKNPSPPPSPEPPEMSREEYFEKFGMAAAGRA